MNDVALFDNFGIWWERGSQWLARADEACEKLWRFVNAHKSLLIVALLLKFIISLAIANYLFG